MPCSVCASKMKAKEGVISQQAKLNVNSNKESSATEASNLAAPSSDVQEPSVVEVHSDEENQARVMALTASNFQSAVGRDVHFIKFYAPWCGHCKRLAPAWEKLASKFDGDPKIKIAEVDCSAYESVCQSAKVDGYPTLVLYKDGRRMEEYHGKRDVEELARFVERYAK